MRKLIFNAKLMLCTYANAMQLRMCATRNLQFFPLTKIYVNARCAHRKLVHSNARELVSQAQSLRCNSAIISNSQVAFSVIAHRSTAELWCFVLCSFHKHPDCPIADVTWSVCVSRKSLKNHMLTHIQQPPCEQNLPTLFTYENRRTIENCFMFSSLSHDN